MPESENKPGLSYLDAGVDIQAGNDLVQRIKPAVKRARRDGVLGGLGGFGGLFEIPLEHYRRPVLVSGTDGVGTKLRLAIDLEHYHTVGIDLVAMCVNDIIVSGAEPLYFLDYYATGTLDVNVAATVIEGIAEGCVRAGSALIGGETAEMPGMYSEKDFDLAGFAVGIVDYDRMIDPSSVRHGDRLIGLASSGAHSNGYSLIRKVLQVSGADPQMAFEDRTLGEALLEPTRIYVKPMLSLTRQMPVHAMAHITGGGLLENLPRVMNPGQVAHIDAASWQMPKLFTWLSQQGGIAADEMYRTFNCGIGMVVIVPAEAADQAMQILQREGEQAIMLGHIEQTDAATAEPHVLIQ